MDECTPYIKERWIAALVSLNFTPLKITLTQSRRALYQLSYQDNSAGRGSNLQHNTRQRQTSNHCAMAQYTLNMINMVETLYGKRYAKHGQFAALVWKMLKLTATVCKCDLHLMWNYKNLYWEFYKLWWLVVTGRGRGREGEACQWDTLTESTRKREDSSQLSSKHRLKEVFLRCVSIAT